MNRIIRFRGRRADGKWLFGDLIHNRGKVYIADDTIVDGNDIKGHTDFEVDPDTIGQYIGRDDDWRNHIYAGDILMIDLKEGKWAGIVEYSEYMVGYFVRLIIGGRASGVFTAIPKQCEIIDNIYEQTYIKIQA